MMLAAIEAATSVNPFEGGEASTHHRLGNVHHFLQLSSLLGEQVGEPGHNTINMSSTPSRFRLVIFCCVLLNTPSLLAFTINSI